MAERKAESEKYKKVIKGRKKPRQQITEFIFETVLLLFRPQS